MKTLKVSLFIIVILTISACIFFGILKLNKISIEKKANNPFIAKVEAEIKQLNLKSNINLCKEYYDEVAYIINEFHQQGRLGNNKSDNNQMKEFLESNLFSTYAEQFVKQAKYVLERREWDATDLRFIQVEKNRLKNSNILVAGSPVDKDFTLIQTALNKYNEINNFISNCNNFTYNGTALSDRFPIADVEAKINHAASLLSNNLENKYVNNCTRLHHGLNQIPQTLFNAHVKYLEEKITIWTNLYSYNNSWNDYKENLYSPLISEIETLDNNIYNVSNFQNDYNRLLDLLKSDSRNAYDFFN